MEKTIPSEKIEKTVYDILIEMAKKLKSSGIDTMEIKNMKIIGYKQYEERVMLITNIPQGSDEHYHVVIYTNSEKVKDIIKAIKNKRDGEEILLSGKFKILLHGERINFESNDWDFEVKKMRPIPLDVFFIKRDD
ncbi:MAG: hypothetical protein RXP92_01545 [Candidatus Micrarchaeota archaeon]